jgi:hypothetical protein
MSLEILRQMGMTDEQIQEKLLDTIASRFLSSTHPDVFDDEDDYELAFNENSDDLSDEERAGRQTQVEALRKEASIHKLLGTHLRRHFEKMFAGAVSSLGTQFVQPILQEMISKKVFQHTNTWGEPKGDPKTSMEFLESHCKNYLLEEVDENLQSKEECSQWNRDRWKSAGKRIDVLVKKGCSERVREVVKEATAAAAKAVGEAYREKINCAVSMAIDSVKIEVKK